MKTVFVITFLMLCCRLNAQQTILSLGVQPHDSTMTLDKLLNDSVGRIQLIAIQPRLVAGSNTTETQSMIVQDKGIDMSLIQKSKTLPRTEWKTLQNCFRYAQDGTGACYYPRHGIIFYDKSNQPITYMEICFECDRVRFLGQAFTQNFEIANETFVELKKLFREKGFVISDEH